MIKVIAIATVLIFTGCSMFPSTTSVSATSKLDDADSPTVKVQQNFKWN